MFELISIFHNGPHSLPQFYVLSYSSRCIKLHFLKRPTSVLGVLPTIYSFAKDNQVYFSTNPVSRSDNKTHICISAYISFLEEYMPYYLVMSVARANSEMDLVRTYFQSDQLSKTSHILCRMAPSAEGKMLLYYLMNRPKDWRYNGYVSWNTTNDSATAKWKNLRSTANKLDESTRILFILHLFHLIPENKYLNLAGALHINSRHLKIYMLIKLAALTKGRPRLYTFFNFQAAMQLNTGEDITLRNNLLYDALSSVPHNSWKRLLLGALAKLKDLEIKEVGGTTQQPWISLYKLQPSENIRISIEPFETLFRLDPARKLLKHTFIDTLCISADKLVEIEYLRLAGDILTPVYALEDKFYASIEYMESIEIIEALLKDGRRVPKNASFKQIRREWYLKSERVNISNEEVEVIFRWEPKDLPHPGCEEAGNECSNFQTPAIFTKHLLEWRNNSFAIRIPKEGKAGHARIKMLVEVKPTIFEEMVFNFDLSD